MPVLLFGRGQLEPMGGRPGGDELTKGALVALQPSWASHPVSITFQFNPDQLVRRLSPSPDGGTCETIHIRLELDAMADPPGSEVEPTISALELLLQDSQGDHSEPGPAATPALFSWGERTVPVRVAELEIFELMHDRELKVLRAEIEVQLEVLTAGPEPSRYVQAYREWKAGRAGRLPQPDPPVEPDLSG